MIANSKKKHWGQILDGIKITIDDLGLLLRRILATFDITTNDKNRVRADVARNPESSNFSRYYASI